MSRTLLVAATLAASWVAVNACAADLPAPVYKGTPPAAVAVPAFSWTGFYVGAEIGGGWGNAPSPYGAPFTATTFPFYQAPSAQRGIFGGGYVGYNFQFDKVVLGLEGDINADAINGDDGGSGGNVNGVAHKWNADIRGRLGYAIFDNTLVYAAGGVSFLNASATNLSRTPIESINRNWTGWTIGGGIEYAITPNLIARVEYRYTDYGNSIARFPLSGYAERINPRINAVLAGIAYKF